MKRCTFKQASGPLPPLDFVLPGLLLGTAGLIVGPGAVGKTFLALQISIGVALGDPVCAGADGELFPAGRHGKVAVVLGEDQERMVLHRQQALIEGLGLTLLQRELLDKVLQIESSVEDDLPLLRKSPREWRVCPTPFLGEAARNLRRPAPFDPRPTPVFCWWTK